MPCSRSKRRIREAIPFTVNILPSTRKFAELCISPYSLSFIKEQTIVFYFSFADAVLSKVVVELVRTIRSSDHLNTGKFFTVHIIGIANPTVRCSYTVFIKLSICPFSTEQLTTSSTLQNTINEIIAMSSCRNCCTPIHDRFTFIAIGTASIAVFRAGGCYIVNSMCRMDMASVPSCLIILAFLCLNHELLDSPCFSITEYTFTSKGICIAVY